MTVDNLREYTERNLYKYSITTTEKVSKRQKTDKELEEEYVQNVCAIGFIRTVMLFNICFDVKEILVNVNVVSVDRTTGNEQFKCLYSVIVPRELVKTYKMENVDPVAAIMSLKGNVDIRKSREIYYVEPLAWVLENDEIIIDYKKFVKDFKVPEKYEALVNALIPESDNFCELLSNNFSSEKLLDNKTINVYASGMKKLYNYNKSFARI